MTLVLRDVVKHYPSAGEVVRAVDGITLEVAAGEMVALYGPSGSGKTTLLMLAAALLKPDSGSVAFGGRELGGLSEREASEYRLREVGVIFQEYELMAGVPAVENAAMKLLADPISISDARRQVLPWLSRVGLDDRLEAVPEQLSGGERQRVAIARALANGPRLVLADEPTGSLDTRRGRDILRLLHTIAYEDGVAVLLVTHDPEAAELADRALTLRDGRIVDADPGASASAESWDDPASLRGG